MLLFACMMFVSELFSDKVRLMVIDEFVVEGDELSCSSNMQVQFNPLRRSCS